MTLYNDNVAYNADLTYLGDVPAGHIAAAATVTIDATAGLTLAGSLSAAADVAIDATAALEQHHRSWLDAEDASAVDATARLALTRPIGLVSSTAIEAAADLTVSFLQFLDADAATSVDASAGLVHAGRIGVAASVGIVGRAGLALLPAPPLTVTVAGSALALIRGSLEVEQAIGQRSTARMLVDDEHGDLTFHRGDQIEITDRGTLLWSGYLDSVQSAQVGITAALHHSLTCIDQQYLADKRIAARTYNPGVTCGDVVRDLHATYLADEGVTLGAVEDGATLEQGMLVNYQPVSGALDALVDASDDYVWMIDATKVLTFQHKSSVTAPWTVDVSTSISDPRPALTIGNPDYRNVQWILGGLAVTDPQTETRIGDGETQAFTMSYPLAKVPTVLLNGAAQVVGIKGLEDESTYDFGWNKGDSVISQSSQGTKLTASDTLTVTYQGQYAIVARVDDPTGIAAAADVEGGSGIVEQATSPGNINSADQAFSLGQSRLDTYDRPGIKLQFDTYNAGLAAGQWVTVNLPLLGLDGSQMLIESVTGNDPGSGRLRWTVTAVDGPTTMPWQKVLGAPPELRKDDLVSVGSGTVVALVVSPRETTAWSEGVVNHPMTCELLPYTLPVTLC